MYLSHPPHPPSCLLGHFIVCMQEAVYCAFPHGHLPCNSQYKSDRVRVRSADAEESVSVFYIIMSSSSHPCTRRARAGL